MSVYILKVAKLTLDNGEKSRLYATKKAATECAVSMKMLGVRAEIVWDYVECPVVNGVPIFPPNFRNY